jgi:hypothetical protein
MSGPFQKGCGAEADAKYEQSNPAASARGIAMRKRLRAGVHALFVAFAIGKNKEIGTSARSYAAKRFLQR